MEIATLICAGKMHLANKAGERISESKGQMAKSSKKIENDWWNDGNIPNLRGKQLEEF